VSGRTISIETRRYADAASKSTGIATTINLIYNIQYEGTSDRMKLYYEDVTTGEAVAYYSYAFTYDPAGARTASITTGTYSSAADRIAGIATRIEEQSNFVYLGDAVRGYDIFVTENGVTTGNRVRFEEVVGDTPGRIITWALRQDVNTKAWTQTGIRTEDFNFERGGSGNILYQERTAYDNDRLVQQIATYHNADFPRLQSLAE